MASDRYRCQAGLETDDIDRSRELNNFRPQIKVTSALVSTNRGIEVGNSGTTRNFSVVVLRTV
ncbi:uncharacterized protein BO88DRAFT_405719, partial [Aspergillus vadensis CBS 113365]